MKIAYFDCSSGVSGDMILGAMVDAGLELPRLKMRLNQLSVKGFEIKTRSARRGPFVGTKFDVQVQPQKQKSFEVREMENIIRQSRLDDSTKKTVEAIRDRWLKAEIKAHGNPKGLRFQADQAIDLLVDIVGCVIGLNLMGIDEVVASPMNLGSGFVEVHGGKVPVPAPATTELVRGHTIYSSGPQKELTTPTGAAIITTLVTSSTSFPHMRLQKVGYGAGSQEFANWPNMLRMLVGEVNENLEEDGVIQLETNIDDLNPQIYEHLMDCLFSAGALDVYLTPITMKKSRPGTLLTVLAENHHVQPMTDIIFQETSTLGIRQTELIRRKLPRSSQLVDTRFGRVQVKVVSQGGGKQKRLPEYQDCKRIAKETGLPLRQIMDELGQTLNPAQTLVAKSTPESQ